MPEPRKGKGTHIAYPMRQLITQEDFVLRGAQTGMGIQETQASLEFFVGQEGEFLLLDSFSNPIETVTGKILRLMEGNHTDALYAMIQTERGIRPARLA